MCQNGTLCTAGADKTCWPVLLHQAAMLALEQRCDAAVKAIGAACSSGDHGEEPLSEAALIARMGRLTTAATASWSAVAASLARSLAATEEFDDAEGDLGDGVGAGGTPRDDVAGAARRGERALLAALDVPAGLACAAAAQLHARAAAAAGADAAAVALPEAPAAVPDRAADLAGGEPDQERAWGSAVEAFGRAWAALLRGVQALGRLVWQGGGQAPTTLARRMADLVDGLPGNAVGLAGLELAGACACALGGQVCAHTSLQPCTCGPEGSPRSTKKAGKSRVQSMSSFAFLARTASASRIHMASLALNHLEHALISLVLSAGGGRVRQAALARGRAAAARAPGHAPPAG